MFFTLNKDWRINMRNRMSAIIALTMIVSCGLIFAVTFWPAHGQTLDSDRAVKPCVREGKAKRATPVAWTKVFKRLGVTVEQQEEMKELRRQFRDDLRRLRRAHRESLLNVLDEEQRQKLEEKRGEKDSNLEDREPPWVPRPRPEPRPRPVPRPRPEPRTRDDADKDENTIELNLLDVGSRKTIVEPTTWGNVKR